MPASTDVLAGGAHADLALMLRVKAGDRESFDEVVRAYRAPVIQYIQRIIRNQDAAEDLAQEVFLRVYRARASWVPKANFRSWLYTVATNLAFNWLRGQRTRHRCTPVQEARDSGKPIDMPDVRPSVQAVLIKAERASQVRAAVSSLPPKQRAAVIMHKYEELEYEQIAVVLGCSLQAVRSLLFRAYERLRGELATL